MSIKAMPKSRDKLQRRKRVPPRGIRTERRREGSRALTGGRQPVQCGQAVFDGDGDGLRARRDFELREDTLDVKSDRSFTHPENLADFPVGLSVLHPIQDRDFPRRELLDAAIGFGRRFRRRSQKGHVDVRAQVFHERDEAIGVY